MPLIALGYIKTDYFLIAIVLKNNVIMTRHIHFRPFLNTNVIYFEG